MKCSRPVPSYKLYTTNLDARMLAWAGCSSACTRLGGRWGIFTGEHGVALLTARMFLSLCKGYNCVPTRDFGQ